MNRVADVGKINIVDIGAARFEATEYKFSHLIDSGQATLYGFEPGTREFADLCLRFPDRSKYRFNDVAVGDGEIHTYRACKHGGRSSLLEPNIAVCKHYDSFAEWMEVEKRVDMQTYRLDDLDDITDIDLLKIDTQGSELSILRGAENKLKSTLVVECEVEFISQYVGQPRFSEIEIYMRSQGFLFHSFLGYGTRPLTPYDEDNDPREGARAGSWLWADALFVRHFDSWSALPAYKQARLATILADVYSAFDFSDRLAGIRGAVVS
jgi:FkbM family methyltransferase